MSAAAIAKLRGLWEKLSFGKVARVIAREPEDVLFIRTKLPSGNTKDLIRSNRTADIPEADRATAEVTWRHYYGFTEEGVYFQRCDCHGIDYDIDLTMTWSGWANHTGGWDKPAIGSLIYGEIEDGRKGKRFKRWRYCPPGFKKLVDAVMNGTSATDLELGRELIASDFPDKFWAIARLVLFDNVQAFVDQFKKHDDRPAHPAFGMPTGCIYRGEDLRVEHRGMRLNQEAAQFIHNLSFRLEEPEWWDAFKKLMGEQGFVFEHPGLGGFCHACAIKERRERRLRFDYDY